MNISTIYITRLASNEIFSPSNKIHREVGWAKVLSAPLSGKAGNKVKTLSSKECKAIRRGLLGVCSRGERLSIWTEFCVWQSTS
jgi:hypothetical protein